MSDPPAAPDAGRADRVGVRILGVPLDLVERSQQYHDSLQREFRLIAMARPEDRSHVTARLLRVSDALSAEFAATGRDLDEQLEAAAARGDRTIDFVVWVPATREAAEACRRLDALLDEADEYCRRGELLNVATPPDCLELRRWYLAQFVAQIGGDEPTPWDRRG